MAYTLVDLDSAAAPEVIARIARIPGVLSIRSVVEPRSRDVSANELERLREEIDRLNDRILENLNERARLARAIGTLKVGQAYRPEREAQVLRRIKERNKGPLADETVALLFREIMSACLALERPITVAYLGPVGTFSESAAMKHFGHGAVGQPAPSIDEVYRAVRVGRGGLRRGAGGELHRRRGRPLARPDAADRRSRCAARC